MSDEAPENLHPAGDPGYETWTVTYDASTTTNCVWPGLYVTYPGTTVAWSNSETCRACGEVYTSYTFHLGASHNLVRVEDERGVVFDGCRKCLAAELRKLRARIRRARRVLRHA